MSQDLQKKAQTNAEENRRLFIGCEVDSQFTDQILQVIKKLKAQLIEREIEGLWSRPENLHLTLIFLGPIPGQSIEGIQEILRQAASDIAPFQLRTPGIGCFPDERSARVIFAKVARSQALLDLQSHLEDRLVQAGIHAREDREYIPHITLVKLRNPKAVRTIIDPWVRKDFGRLTVSKITLYESVQSGHYRKYTPLAAEALIGKPSVVTE